MKRRSRRLRCPKPGCTFKTWRGVMRLEDHIIDDHPGWTVTNLATGERICIPCELRWRSCPAHRPAPLRSVGLFQVRGPR